MVSGVSKTRPADCAPWYGIGGGGEDCVENPLASLPVPAAGGLDVVKVERVVAGKGTIEASLKEGRPPVS